MAKLIIRTFFKMDVSTLIIEEICFHEKFNIKDKKGEISFNLFKE